ncbi:hypothetical protein PoB_002223400 [Plakobranchus ocellatus]|uniref:Uncharacterized protein n=1 Tax=Plakobranchus ocellatus TaxID=259542 RepID=A0AAV3ZK87_9GAST|nr:hypothetical protein PoB_002223400 [Plakobranchus ocellatus]
MIPACPPGPVKQHKFCSRVNKDSLEDEPACARRLNLQDDDHLDLSIQQYLRLQIHLCTRTSHLPLTRALAPKKNCGNQKVSKLHKLSKNISPKRLEFLDSEGDNNKEAIDSGYESPNHAVQHI